MLRVMPLMLLWNRSGISQYLSFGADGGGGAEAASGEVNKAVESNPQVDIFSAAPGLKDRIARALPIHA